jgi:hypothetical protein
MSTTERRVHSGVEVCPNRDRSLNLADPSDAYSNAGDGSPFCALCEGRFDDPQHGWATKCKRKTAHVCKLAAPC